MDYILRKITLPTTDCVTTAVAGLWRDCFGQEEVDCTRAQFAGEETDFNIDTLYVLECNGSLCACCHITRRRGTGLAMLGGVASAPAFRGQGFGRAVCEFALSDFDNYDGEAIWLATENPIAADLYESIGFHYLAGTHVMARLRTGTRIMALQRKLYSGGECVVQKASPSMRVPMIPLISSRSQTVVLDANVGLCGNRQMALTSCTGLYPRYMKVRERGGECLFMQDAATCAVAGLATAVTLEDGTVQADAFWHENYTSQASTLLKALADCFPRRRLCLPVIDDAKAKFLQGLGATETSPRAVSFGRFRMDMRIFELVI